MDDGAHRIGLNVGLKLSLRRGSSKSPMKFSPTLEKEERKGLGSYYK